MELKKIHLKNILNLLKEDGDCSKQELLEKLELKFGDKVTYTNCSGSEFDYDGILNVMISKGKISMDSENNIHLIKVCSCSKSKN